MRLSTVAAIAFLTVHPDIHAQQCLICDAITRIPIRDVVVLADGKDVGKTTYKGIILLPEGFTKATFSKRDYRTETLYNKEVLRDTVFLFPVENSIDEVTVWGKHLVNANSLRKNIPYTAPDHKAPHGALEFDFASMLDRRKARDMKQLEKLRESFRKMDIVGDPILNAYHETLNETDRKEIKKDSLNNHSGTTDSNH